MEIDMNSKDYRNLMECARDLIKAFGSFE